MKNLKFNLLFILSFFITDVFSQETAEKNGIENPSNVTTHHFGIHSSRINTNFKINPPKKSTFSVTLESGNIMHPYLEAYLPKDPEVRQQLSQVEWFFRRFNFIDQETTPAEYMNIVADAVIKGLRINYSTRLSDDQELSISLRTFIMSKGKYPFSIFTGDEFLEWFHSNIAGGEDPFGRRYYGLNQVNFKYTDRNGRVMEMKNGDVIFGGAEINYYYYPKNLINPEKNIHLNFGAHLGINTSKFNPSSDVGLSVNAVKRHILKNNNEFNFGLGINVLRKNLINFDDVIDLGNNKFLGTLESTVEFTKYTERKNYHSFGINYQIQTRYNKKKEADYYKLIGEWDVINAGWHNGISTLYDNLSNWNFLYTYGTPKYKLSMYLKEDLNVNNAPDIQTGISVKFPIGNK